MDKANVIHPYIGILISNKKEETIDTYKMDASQSLILDKRSQVGKTTYCVI